MKYNRNPQIFSKLIDGVWVLLKQDSAYCFKLNETAGFLWESLNKPKTVDELAKLVKSAYDIEEQQAATDVSMFIKNGLVQGFILKKT